MIQLDKEKRENLNILKDYKSINLSKIEYIVRKNLKSKLESTDISGVNRIDKSNKLVNILAYNNFLNSSKFDIKKDEPKVNRRYELRQNKINTLFIFLY